MPATFRHHVRLADAKPLRDGLAAVMYDGTGDPAVVIDIRRVMLRLPGMQTSNTAPLNLDLVYCTAATGGIPVDPIKMDTAADDLPAEVVGACMPDAVTISATIRGLADGHGMSLAGQLTGSRIRNNMRTAASSDFAHILSKIGGSAAIEPITLREGEGIALVLRTGGGGTGRAMRARVKVRETTSGNCYFYRFNDIASCPLTGGIFSLMNNTGSGVVLEVRAIEFPPEGDSSVIPRTQLALIDGFEDSSNFDGGNMGGVEFTPAHIPPVQFDSANVLPPSVKCVGAGFIARKTGTWALADWWFNTASIASLANQQNRGPIFRPHVMQMPSRGVTTGPLTTAGLNNRGVDGVDLWCAPPGAEGIILRPGHGFAVLGGHAGNLDNGAYSSYDIYIDFIVRSDARGRRAGMSYVS